MTKVLADMPNKETMSSIYEAIADMSDHHLKVASSYEELEKILDERSMKMNLKRVKRMVPIQVGERTAYEVDRDGKWLISWGTPITINGFDFFFVPISNAKGVVIQAYSLDSLKLFTSQQISFKTAYLNCATEADFIKTVMPMIVRIDKDLREPKSDSFWKDFLKNEYLAAIIECGARNEKERRLLKKFDNKEN